MLAASRDPIVAIATASGRGAVGIVRVSGAGLAPFVSALLGRTLKAREATYLPFPDAAGQPIDHGLALWFPGPHSYTGEDVLELQGHGGPVVLQLLLARCLEVARSGEPVCLPGLRPARAGEFTERAFLNDKLDLAQAEAVADLIDASTEAAARSASRSLAGVFSERIHALRDALVNLRMLVEATLDFPEEEIDFLQKADASGQLGRLREGLSGVLNEARQGALLRDGMKVVIAGQPNAGKSSLLNALAGAELAIVTPIAGTTRDVVQQTIQIEGVPLHVVDTAGLRDSPDVDEVEHIGIQRAWGQIQQADAVLFLHDLSRCDQPAYQAADAAIAADLPAGVSLLPVWNKLDQCSPGAQSFRLGLAAGRRAGHRVRGHVAGSAALDDSTGRDADLERSRGLQDLRPECNRHPGHQRLVRASVSAERGGTPNGCDQFRYRCGRRAAPRRGNARSHCRRTEQARRHCGPGGPGGRGRSQLHGERRRHLHRLGDGACGRDHP
jgi:tRNA modification GTPase